MEWRLSTQNYVQLFSSVTNQIFLFYVKKLNATTRIPLTHPHRQVAEVTNMTLLWKTRFERLPKFVPASFGGLLLLSLFLPLSGSLHAQNTAASDLTAVDSIPVSWSYESSHYTTSPSDDNWWKGFEDPVLTSLIAMGEENSYNLAMVARRIEMARQTLAITQAGYSPTLGLSAGWDASRSSGALSTPTVPGHNSSFFNIGLNLSWEIDLFGRIREQAKGDKAQYNASKAEYTAAMISLSSNIAQAYVNLRLAQGRIEIARKQIETQEKITAIAKARYETGLSSKLDVAQAQTVLYTTQANLPGLISSETSAINAIALLVGVYPSKINSMLREPHRQLNPFRMVNIGVPSDLIRRRPDILQAEYELAGYAAQVGIAKKDFLPTLTLNGSIGTSALRLDDLFSKNSLTYSVAPTLSWTIFEGMARSHRVAYAKEQMLAGIDNYNQVVMNAVIETEDALDSYETSLHQIALEQKVCAEGDEAFNLAVDRYKRGLSPFNDVMNALTTVLNNQNDLIRTKANALSSLIKVYAAVAGSPGE